MDKITLFAMTEKGFAVTRSLISTFPECVEMVVGSRDKSVAKDYYDEIAAFCRDKQVRFCNRADDFIVQSRYALAVSWRWLIDSNRSRVIVFHDSLLPRYRGFNPLVTALLNGDSEIGVTALYATEEYDRGDIIAQSQSAIAYPMAIQSAIEIIAKNYEDLALQIGASVSEGSELHARPQDDAAATYSLWRDEEDYLIDWNQSATYLRRFVDAVGYPYKGAATNMTNQLVRILDVEEHPDVDIANRAPGKVIFVHDGKPIVVCGRGLLKINQMVDDETKASLLPLQRFRTRFKR